MWWRSAGSIVSSRRARAATLACWATVAAALWLLVATGQSAALDRPAVLPDNSAPIRAAATIDSTFSHRPVPQGDPRTLIHIVIESSAPLDAAAHDYYDSVVAGLAGDTTHVSSVLSPWSDPLSAAIAEAPDHRSNYAMVWVPGASGSARQRAAVESVQHTIDSIPAPAGLHATVQAPGPPPANPILGRLTMTLGVLTFIAVVLGCCRPLPRGALIVGTALSTAAVAVPLLLVLHHHGIVALSPWSLALAIAVTVGATTEFARILTRHRTREAVTGSARSIPVLAGVGAVILTAGCATKSPVVHDAGIPALIGLLTATLGAATIVPAVGQLVTGRSGPRLRWLRRIAWAYPRQVCALAIAVAVAAAFPLMGLWHSGFHSNSSTGTLPAGRLAPEIVMLTADHDLRSPDGLIAIDRVTRAIMSLPGIERVRSASWPAGTPWPEATFAFQAGELGKQLQRNAATITTQLRSITTLTTALDHLDAAAAQLHTSITAGTAGLRKVDGAGSDITAGIRDLRATTESISGQLEPLRSWADGVPNCPADVLCTAARKLLTPMDDVIRGVGVVTDGAAQLHEGSSDAVDSLAASPGSVSQMQAALAQVRGLIPGLTDTIDSVLPQLVQLTSFLKNVSLDFKTTGEGGFYLPRKALNAPSYRQVKETLFSPDGHATRLFVYGDPADPELPMAARSAAITSAVAGSTKYGGLADAQVTVTGAGTIQHAVNDLARHDLVVMSLAVALVGLITGLTRIGWRPALVATLIPPVACCAMLGAVDPSPALLVAYLSVCAMGLPYALAPILTARGRSARATLTTVRAAPGVLGCAAGIALGVALAGWFGTSGLLVAAAMGLTLVAVPLCVTASAAQAHR